MRIKIPIKIKNNWTIYQEEINKKGCRYFISARIIKISDILSYFYKSYLSSKKCFIFQNQKYQYFCSRYNFAWKNERTMEIPIFWDIIKANSHKRILEIGNVLNHYHTIHHDVLDKYEITNGVINEDVVTFQTKTKYDLIISISTMEHVGWDEKPRQRYKIIPAINNLKSLLARNGKIIMSLPLGYNKDLDELLQLNKLPFYKTYYLKRMNKKNEWDEANWNEVKNSRYNSKFPNANAIIIGYVKK
jgi:hypothetical protein